MINAMTYTGYIIIMFCFCHIYNWMTYMRRQYVWIFFQHDKSDIRPIAYNDLVPFIT